MQKPTVRPTVPNFSSGPCAKRPGWTPEVLSAAFLARSHRHALGRARLREVLTRTRAVLQIPDSHVIAIMPGSDTGAMEAAMWGLLGPRGVDVLATDNFGSTWAKDITDQLKLPDVTVHSAPYGEMADFDAIDWSNDFVFCWNGTTAGTCLPDGDVIPATRGGLTLCDATSAAGAFDLPWDKLDVTTYSWQKVLGGEAAHGMLILGPRAVERFESHSPSWPMPKVFRLLKNGELDREFFDGITLNTPSMLCVEDCIDALKWAESIGGVRAMVARTQRNFAALCSWVDRTPWIDYVARDAAYRSPTSVTLKITDPAVAGLAEDQQFAFVRQLAAVLEDEGAAFDIKGHRLAPPGLRIWCGATVETADVEALGPWLDWGFAICRQQVANAA